MGGGILWILQNIRSWLIEPKEARITFTPIEELDGRMNLVVRIWCRDKFNRERNTFFIKYDGILDREYLNNLKDCLSTVLCSKGK